MNCAKKLMGGEPYGHREKIKLQGKEKKLKEGREKGRNCIKME